MNILRLRFLAAATFFVLLSFANGVAQADQPTKPPFDLPARFTAVAYTQSGATQTFGVTIYVDAVSSEGEIEELAATLKQKGQDGLENAMDDLKDKGRVAPAASTGVGMEVVRIRPGKDGGYHIVLLGNRRIVFGSVSRVNNYKFSIVALNVDKDGKGTGLLAPACLIKFKNNKPEIENYGQKPLRLEAVKLQK